jgi:hypothetical protein
LITDIFCDCPINTEYKPKFTISESFEFNSIKKENVHDRLHKQLNQLISQSVENIKCRKLPVIDLTDYEGIYAPKDLDELEDIIYKYYLLYFQSKPIVNLNWLDVSRFTNFVGLFYRW